ncbi:hypothetical protein M1446_01920 [Candidatus Dependentiae bacterium]|nr:hypothetical protein [Candidatus Dependentiae bacterium]
MKIIFFILIVLFSNSNCMDFNKISADELDNYLKMGFDPNLKDSHGWSPLTNLIFAISKNEYNSSQINEVKLKMILLINAGGTTDLASHEVYRYINQAKDSKISIECSRAFKRSFDSIAAKFIESVKNNNLYKLKKLFLKHYEDIKNDINFTLTELLKYSKAPATTELLTFWLKLLRKNKSDVMLQQAKEDVSFLETKHIEEEPVENIF